MPGGAVAELTRLSQARDRSPPGLPAHMRTPARGDGEAAMLENEAYHYK